ncbi:endonuclease/exonuclease/phosphatase family protein [Amorphus orientalis]|uniref:Endonuclease/exonuclease/phosphatase (EEP) superfamily protein YafD n=1 Tax=Amorphus orientalis TaxID=649198 RepID=A0AAE3VRI0_9HYPH|nr:endonuclease/exonuclease/phosphatase family protein [Amorphus orientalis]MDQ0316510.1 endonuclease/exonuclease/phosphatase (EEP) superfamily protein YafD [Amorphus orientalis]
MAGWLIDNGFNFLPQIVAGLAGLFALVAILARRAWALVIAAALVVALTTGLVLTKRDLVSAPGGEGGGVRVMTANLLFSNRDTAAVAAALRSLKPDLVAVQERDRFWVGALGDLLADDYRLVSESASGTTALYGKTAVPICATPTFRSSVPDRVAAGCVEIDGRPTLVLAVHAPRPTRPLEGAERTATFIRYRALIAEAGLLAIVAGDHNASPLSPAFRRYLGETGLSLPREPGLWFAATWPSRLPQIGIRIDHVLTTPGLSTRFVATGPQIGSNHLPLTVDVGVR